MKCIKRILCLLISLLFIVQSLTACSSKKDDNEIYLTKGEFFAYFVHEKNMTSDKYSADEINNCEDGSIEADIIVEWGYLTEKQAKNNLKSSVTKETVVTVCANATFDLKEGKASDIKDIGLLDSPQLIANAYASGLFDLENGYFDGKKKMSFADCEEIINRANEYTANFHYEANTEITNTADDVKEQDVSSYSNGDIIIEVLEDEINTSGANYSADELFDDYSFEKKSYSTLSSTTDSICKDNMFEIENKNLNVVPLANNIDYFGFQNVKGFSATIIGNTFEKALGNPKIGDTVVIRRSQLLLTNQQKYVNTESEIIGVLVNKQKAGSNYICMFEYPEFEQAVEKKNVEKANNSGIDIGTFIKEKTEVDGWKLEFDVSGSSIKVNAKKNFGVYETGRKQNWQNSKKTMTASADLSIGNFNLDVNNLKSFAKKNGKGYIKITCDTDIGFSLSQSLRYTPDSNRNGKFPSNWSNSRWTDADSKGAKTIKIARFSPNLYGVVGVDVYIYLLISVDGKVSFTTSIKGGGVQITANEGKISTTKLGKKESEFSANVNLHNRFGVDASLKIFSFINVIEYDVGANLDLHATVDLYYEEKLSKSGVYADEEGLNEYASDDAKFNYCIGIIIELSVSGMMKDSGVKLILDLLSKGDSLDFELSIWSGGFHFEDGAFVDECSRGNEKENIEETTDDEIELSAYKVSMYTNTCEIVDLEAVPSQTVDLMDSKNSITVKSKNKNIVTTTYNKKNKTIILEAVDEGSTEVVITAKKGILWWKKTVEQEISVTVNDGGNIEGMSFSIIYPTNANNLI